ncbi:MAG: DivIVA domain-containing protein [Synergistaceae bacterium]|nr:DivIVA domain-containing protein [Synergistaceae bacterium]
MTELMSALDVANKVFGRVFKGYNPGEVDAFLDQISESLHGYAQQILDLQRELDLLRDKEESHEKLKESLQETLLFAQKSSEERLQAAEKQAQAVIAEAKAQADRIVGAAQEEVALARRELKDLQEKRQEFLADFRALLFRYQNLLEGGSEAERP